MKNKIIILITILFIGIAFNSTLTQAGTFKAKKYTVTSDGYTYTIQDIAGDGDATLITCQKGNKKSVTLIDAGNYNSANKSALNTFVKNTLSKQYNNKIDNVIITHNHNDHIGGLLYLLKDKKVTISNLYLNNIDYTKKLNSVAGQSADDIVKEYTKSKNKLIKNYRLIKSAIYSTTSNDSVINLTSSKNGVGTEKLHILAGLTNLEKAKITFDVVAEAWQINNSSMMVVLNTSTDKVIFSGDVHYYTMACLLHNWYYGYTSSVQSRNSAYWTAINTHLFYNSKYDKNKQIVYKVSHHGNRGSSNPELKDLINTNTHCLFIDSEKNGISYGHTINFRQKNSNGVLVDMSKPQIEGLFINKIVGNGRFDLVFDTHGRCFSSDSDVAKAQKGYFNKVKDYIKIKGVADDQQDKNKILQHKGFTNNTFTLN